MKYTMNRIMILFYFCFIWIGADAQTAKEEIFENPEKAGGVYYAYPDKGIPAATKIPDGYEPFYISYYGRHGSRYLIK